MNLEFKKAKLCLLQPHTKLFSFLIPNPYIKVKKEGKKTEDDMLSDINDLDLQVEIIENQKEWRRRIRADDYWN